MPAYQQCNTRKLEPEDHYVNYRTSVRMPSERQYKEDPASLSGPVIEYNIKEVKKECEE